MLKQKFIIFSTLILFLISGCSKKDDYQVNDMKESTKVTSKEIGKFSIFVDGMFTKTITNISLENANIKMYDFSARTTMDGKKFESNKWTGIKVSDLFDYYKFANFENVYFKGQGATSVGYLAKEGFDDMYIVFYKDGKLLDEKDGPLFLAAKFKTRFWIYGLSGISFK